MDSIIIDNINEKVREKDRLFILGDFAFRNCINIEDYRNRIRCKNIFLVLGNHDPQKGKKRKELDRIFTSVQDLMQIKSHNEQRIILCHYAMRTWNCSHYGNWHLYGHSHGSLLDDPNSLSFDVGVDCHNYYPINFDEVAAIMAKKRFIPIDHHGEINEEPSQIA